METNSVVNNPSTVVSPQRCTTGFITSKDGTTIGYRQRGYGPGVVVLHGSMSTGQNHIQLAEALADAFTVYLPDRRGFGLSGPYGKDYSIQDDVGALFVVVGIAAAFVQAALVGRLVSQYGEKRMALVSLIGTALGLLLIFVAPAFWMLYPIGFAESAVSGFIWSALGTLTANRVSDREQGQLAGVNAALAGLVSALGPLWAGAVYDGVMPGAPYWTGAIILTFAGLLLARAKVASAARQPVPVQSMAE